MKNALEPLGIDFELRISFSFSTSDEFPYSIISSCTIALPPSSKSPVSDGREIATIEHDDEHLIGLLIAKNPHLRLVPAGSKLSYHHGTTNNSTCRQCTIANSCKIEYHCQQQGY
jgi:hypothetical protein